MERERWVLVLALLAGTLLVLGGMKALALVLVALAAAVAGFVLYLALTQPRQAA